MTRGECQICGRKKSLTQQGFLFLHYHKSQVCRGAGELPLEQSYDAIEISIVRLKRIDERLTEREKRYREAAHNTPYPRDQYKALTEAVRERLRLERRLKRILEGWTQRPQYKPEQLRLI